MLRNETWNGSPAQIFYGMNLFILKRGHTWHLGARQPHYRKFGNSTSSWKLKFFSSRKKTSEPRRSLLISVRHSINGQSQAERAYTKNLKWRNINLYVLGISKTFRIKVTNQDHPGFFSATWFLTTCKWIFNLLAW